ncbi:MAG: carboxyl-terminal processing protease [Bacteroidia bacterium]
MIIGRRSFGKGLVQRPFKLRDGSTLKLTTARYYTPAGRCIQRPYEEGNEEYRKENTRRTANGEFFSIDSATINKEEKFLTDNKRVVYAGGGILPDIFIPVDTTENSDFLRDLLRNGLFYQYVNEYVDANREELNAKYPDFDAFQSGFNQEDKMVGDFLAFAEKEMLPKDDEDQTEEEKLKAKEKAEDFISNKEEGLKASDKIIRTRLKALLARTMWQTEAFYRVFNAQDDGVAKAIESIENKTFRKMKLSYN